MIDFIKHTLAVLTIVGACVWWRFVALPLDILALVTRRIK